MLINGCGSVVRGSHFSVINIVVKIAITTTSGVDDPILDR